MKDRAKIAELEHPADAHGLLNVRDAARRAGVHENTIRNWVDAGRLPAVRVGPRGFRRVRAEDVDLLIVDRVQPSADCFVTLERRIDRLEAVIARLPVLAHWLATYGEAQASEDHGKG